AVQDQPVVGVELEFGGGILVQGVFDGARGFAGGEARAVGDAKDVGVDGDLGLAEDDVENDVGGFAADAGERLERVAVGGDFAAVELDQHAAEADQVLGFGVVEADALEVGLHAFLAQRQDGYGGVGDGKELAGRGVDALVGRVGGEHDGD